MWSQANYDPKLADPFFESNEWSYPWYIIKHPDGTFEDTTSDRRPEKEPTRLKQTAKCFSTSSGSEHLVKFCEARLLDANMIDLLIHHESPAFNDTLKVWIRNGVFTCQYWTAQKELISTGMGPGTIWKTTRQELTLDKKVYRKGDVIKGKIDFERVQEPTNPKYIETWGREPTTIKVNGVFKTIVE
jgi:hypothetical protein